MGQRQVTEQRLDSVRRGSGRATRVARRVEFFAAIIQDKGAKIQQELPLCLVIKAAEKCKIIGRQNLENFPPGLAAARGQVRQVKTDQPRDDRLVISEEPPPPVAAAFLATAKYFVERDQILS